MKRKPVQTLVDEIERGFCRKCREQTATIQTYTNPAVQQGVKVTRYEEHTTCSKCGFSAVAEWVQYQPKEAQP